MPETAAETDLTDAAAIEAELQRRLCDPFRYAREAETRFLDCIPRCIAVDGFAVSVQTGRTHYCAPRDNQGPWSAVELGYPTARVDALMPYIDGADSEPTDTVYGYVPLSIVAQVFADHGGLRALASQVPA